MSDLLERLRRVENGDGTGDHVSHWYRNPDGPEAAAEIERLREQLATQETAILSKSLLELIDKWNPEAFAFIGSPALGCGTTREVQKSQGAET